MFHFTIEIRTTSSNVENGLNLECEMTFSLRPLQFHGAQVAFGCKLNLQSNRQISDRHNNTFLTKLREFNDRFSARCGPHLCDVVRYWFNFVKYRPLCVYLT